MNLTYKLPYWEDLPDLGLYLEQLIEYTNGHLVNIVEKEALFTKNMIQNYVKRGSIDKPDNKKYNKDTIARLLVIGIAKGVLEIKDIKSGIELILLREEISTSYNYFVDSLHTNLLIISKIKDQSQKKIINLDDEINLENLSIDSLCKVYSYKLLLSLILESKLKT